MWRVETHLQVPLRVRARASRGHSPRMMLRHGGCLGRFHEIKRESNTNHSSNNDTGIVKKGNNRNSHKNNIATMVIMGFPDGRKHALLARGGQPPPRVGGVLLPSARRIVGNSG